MNLAFLTLDGLTEEPWMQKSCDFAIEVMNELKLIDWDLSLVYTNDSGIQALNKAYRDKDEATDVLSFTLGEFEINEETNEKRFLAGDIVISVDMLATNAQYFSVPKNEELKRLITHGILHLNGNDHETNNEDEPMLIFQEKLLGSFKAVQIL